MLGTGAAALFSTLHRGERALSVPSSHSKDENTRLKPLLTVPVPSLLFVQRFPGFCLVEEHRALSQEPQSHGWEIPRASPSPVSGDEPTLELGADNSCLVLQGCSFPLTLPKARILAQQ